MVSCWEIATSLSFFRFMTNLERSGSRILDEWSVKLTFSFIVTFYLTKTENRTKKSLTALTLMLWVKVLFLSKIADFLKKKMRALGQKVYFLKLHMGVYLRIKFQVSSIILTSFKRGNFSTNVWVIWNWYLGVTVTQSVLQIFVP